MRLRQAMHRTILCNNLNYIYFKCMQNVSTRQKEFIRAEIIKEIFMAYNK